VEQKPKKNGWFVTLVGNKYGEAAVFVICAILISVFFGAIFNLISGGGFAGFVKATKLSFFFVAAPLVVMAVLLLVTNIDRNGNWLHGIGCGLYYGGFGAAYLLRVLGWNSESTGRFVVGFIIAALICYIFYKNNHK
jgi:hypothetical protein